MVECVAVFIKEKEFSFASRPYNVYVLNELEVCMGFRRGGIKHFVFEFPHKNIGK